MSDFLSRVKRRAVLMGGPSDGQHIPVPLPDSTPWPPFVCAKAPALAPDPARLGAWHHYIHDGRGVYGHAGPCAEIDHDGCEPHDHDDCGGAS